MKKMFNRIGTFLTEQAKHKQRLVLFGCLAILAVYGTVTALKLYGEAMNHKRDVLECQLEVHEHVPECLAEGEYACGYADYVVHAHDELCYDWNGKLVCTIPEREVHAHEDECFEEVKKLVCELEGVEADPENADEEVPDSANTVSGGDAAPANNDTCQEEEHAHGEECYSGSECDKTEHKHGDSCYEKVLSCKEEEHAHDDSCKEKVLKCEESEHVHSDGCYDADGELTCGESEHTHEDGCYGLETTCEKTEHEHGDSCYEAELKCEIEEHEHSDSCMGEAELVCGKTEHKHDDSCTSADADDENDPDVEETDDIHVHTDECYVTVKKAVCGELELHEHDEEKCFDEDGKLICKEMELLVHQHDAEDCIVTRDLTPEEIADLGEVENHIHTEECYEDEELACGYPAEHAHKEWCYDEAGELICGYGTLKHVHVDKCYDEDGALVCGYDGEAHLHDETCYDGYGELVCGYESLYHEHVEECYDEEGNVICGYLEAEHEHSDACLDRDGNLVCKFSENHIHDLEECYDEEGNLICELEALKHAHDPECYDEDGNLVCGYEWLKHHHTEECYDEEGNLICGYESADIELRTEVNGITVVLSGPPESFDPELDYYIEADLVWQEEHIAIIDEALAALEEELTEAGGVGNEAGSNIEGDGSGEDADVVAAGDGDGATEADPDATVETKVDGYWAFDIRLMVDGVEVQPLGPVTVRFEGELIEEAEKDSDTTSKVLHIDTETGEVTDMAASSDEEGAVAFETDHFSIYVYVNLKDILFGKIKMTVQHWGHDVTQVAGTAVATSLNDEAFGNLGDGRIGVRTKQIDCEIYEADELTVPNEYYTDITLLSKLNSNLIGNAESGESEEPGDIQNHKINYDMLKVWVSSDMSNIDQDIWPDGSYKEYVFDGEDNVYLRMTDKNAGELDIVPEWNDQFVDGVDGKEREVLVRFWYTPIKADGQYATSAMFYDYDITSGQANEGVMAVKVSGGPSGWNVRETPATATNATGGRVLCTIPANTSKWVQAFERIVVGDYTWYKISYGGKVGWTRGDRVSVETTWGNKTIVSEEQGMNSPAAFGYSTDVSHRMGMGQQSSGNLASWAPNVANGGNGLNAFSFSPDRQTGVVRGLVQTQLENGRLVYNEDVPNGDYFSEGFGSSPRNGYQLLFKQDGDTYTLQYVVDSDGNPVTHDLTDFNVYTSYPGGKSFPSPVYSNDFWPMDREAVNAADPLMGGAFKQYRFLYLNGDELQKSDAPNFSDDGQAHNWHFGMEYKVKFSIGDYTGPMEYYFRGDDDLWLFIDGHLAVDIGGIHSSAGETLDIRAFMKGKGLLDNGEDDHYMQIFYMERGGFGSCCYMQFTLPNSTPVEIGSPETTDFSAQKMWDDGNAEFSAFRPSNIRVELIQQLDGKETATGVFADLKESNGWSCKWPSLPKINGASYGTYSYTYAIREFDIPGYESSYSGSVLTNRLLSTSVSVDKIWAGDEGTQYRPKSVMFQLYYRAKHEDGMEEEYRPYVDINGNTRMAVLNDENGWTADFQNLPTHTNYVESLDEKGYPSYTADEIEYIVYEVYQDETKEWHPYLDNECADGLDGSKYIVSYDAGQTEAGSWYTHAKNSLKLKLQIVKMGASPDGEPSKESIVGAEFELSPQEGDGQVLTGVSGENGVIQWTDGEGNEVGYIPEGTWVLSETKAPDNFDLNPVRWIIHAKVGDIRPLVIELDDGGEATVPVAYAEILDGDTAILTFEYFNYLTLYELPATGSATGALWLQLIGTIVLAAGVIVLIFKTRKRAGGTN